ncbi:MAG: phage tail sheath family protein [Acidaminococcaceae bacterium]
MAYKHGIYGSEVATSLVPMTNVSAGLPIVFGTAPVHLALAPAKVNTPVLCYSYKEAVAAFGYSDDWAKYTLCEFMKSHFALFNMAPVVFVNVLDSSTHKAAVTNESVPLTKGVGIVTKPVLLDTLKVKLTEAGQPLVKGTDYTAAYGDDEELLITVLAGGVITADKQSVVIEYDKVDASLVDKDDIIGGIDVNSGNLEGLELVNQVFPMFGLVPGIIVAPGWSHISDVAAVMKAKTTNINGHFEAICICDADTSTVKKYADVSAWKNTNNFTGERQILCWPKITLGDKTYHMSTQLTGTICKSDSEHDDVPYWYPSNQSLQADGAVVDDGNKIYLDTASAAYLNGQGILTALNFLGGWKAWGNRTCCYPANTDVKDSFIAIRRMFNWVNNTLITSFWSKIDNPANKRLIETIMDSANIWLNGLVSRGFILGGRVEFRKDENPTTDLMDGIIRFHVFITPPSPARDIEFIQEYDPDYISTLFE